MRSWSLGTAAVLLVAGLCGCGDGVSGGDCFPELPTVRPAAVAVGAQLTIASTGFGCDARYDDGKQYGLRLSSDGRIDPIDLGDVDVAPDGSFSVTVTVPRNASPGESSLAVSGSPYDEPCQDTGSSCASYAASLTVLPAP
jgi:hypothetical protein